MTNHFERLLATKYKPELEDEAIRILEDIDIQVEAGELVGLIGPNGAGKSSLLRLLTGVEACSGGEVRVADKPLSLMPAAQRARRAIHRTRDEVGRGPPEPNDQSAGNARWP